MGSQSWAVRAGFRIAAGAVAAAALATSSPAATYTFAVHVTHGPTTFFTPTFTPVDFLQTWTFDPVASASSLVGGGFDVQLQRATATAAWSPTPFDARIASLTGLARPDADLSAYKQTVGGAAPFVRYDIDFAASAGSVLEAVGYRFEKTRSLSLSALGFTLNNFDALDASGLRDLLAFAGPLQWTEQGRSRTTLFGEPWTDTNLVYSGSATLVGFAPTPPPIQPPSAAPEPASWALLLAGFGLAGAHLRRRRLTAGRQPIRGSESLRPAPPRPS